MCAYLQRRHGSHEGGGNLAVQDSNKEKKIFLRVSKEGGDKGKERLQRIILPGAVKFEDKTSINSSHMTDGHKCSCQE